MITTGFKGPIVGNAQSADGLFDGVPIEAFNQTYWTGYFNDFNEVGNFSKFQVWRSDKPFVVGERVLNGGKSYVCVVAGTSAGSGGPTGTGVGITDNTITWNYDDPYSDWTLKQYDNVGHPFVGEFTYLNNSMTGVLVTQPGTAASASALHGPVLQLDGGPNTDYEDFDGFGKPLVVFPVPNPTPSDTGEFMASDIVFTTRIGASNDRTNGFVGLSRLEADSALFTDATGGPKSSTHIGFGMLDTNGGASKSIYFSACGSSAANAVKIDDVFGNTRVDDRMYEVGFRILGADVYKVYGREYGVSKRWKLISEGKLTAAAGDFYSSGHGMFITIGSTAASDRGNTDNLYVDYVSLYQRRESYHYNWDGSKPL